MSSISKDLSCSMPISLWVGRNLFSASPRLKEPGAESGEDFAAKRLDLVARGVDEKLGALQQEARKGPDGTPPARSNSRTSRGLIQQ
jgi:hypothetical protein